ncbi:MAG: ribonuclease P protein component 1 [Candidatus Bathyarchaeota archaeon]|nr:ribonuclease P protein component 1 [Candidatus Bathyarchaeota archaeon]
MKITPNILKQEFIGTKSTISKSSHADYIGLSGKVIDETKNTFSILHKNKVKRLVKNSAIFRFKFCDGTIVEIDGNLLVGRPEDRLKKNIKRLW